HRAGAAAVPDGADRFSRIFVHLGARPVFVDVLADNWCIDHEEVERHITPKTKAIIATNLNGNLCDMDALLEIGKRTGIPVIEDA
ncbi:DegT/DnrJ/EryC1/StrS family aminotransferase, partial [Rhizobium ruizarguesonis]